MWGGLLGNKRPDRGKKNFRGAINFRGGLFGEMPKKGWKNFLVVPKSGGNFLGGSQQFFGGEFFGGGDFLGKCKKGWENFFGECWGSCEPPTILGGNFWKIVKEKNLGGKFWGVVRRGGVRCGRNGA